MASLMSTIFQLLDLQTFLLGSFILLLLLWLKDIKHGLNMPPGPMQWPIFGSLPSVALFGRNDPLAYMKKLGDKYGGLYSMKFGDRFAIVITDYDIMMDALVKQGDIFSTRPPLELFKAARNTPGYHHGLIFGNGKMWQVQRRFAKKAMRDMGVGKKTLEERMQIEATTLVKELKASSGKVQNPNIATQMAVTNIICSIIFGERYEYDVKDFSVILESMRQIVQTTNLIDMRNIFNASTFLPYPKSYKIMRTANERIQAVVKKQIEEHERTLDAVEDRDLLDLCIRKRNADGEDAKYFNDEELPHLVLDLFIAGSETTASSLEWAYLYMVEHPDIQEKCFQEIDKVLGERLPTMADREKLPFVNATISEIQRIRAIAPMNGLHSNCRDATLNGYHIPKGTWVLPMIYAVSADEKHWKNPTEFKPERFLDASGNYVQRESLVTFSVGPRMCPGETLAKMEFFTFFTILIQNLHFSRASADQKIDLEPILGLTWSPKVQQIRVTSR